MLLNLIRACLVALGTKRPGAGSSALLYGDPGLLIIEMLLFQELDFFNV